MIKKTIAGFGMALGLVGVAQAELGDWSDPQPYYGNAQTPGFRRAMGGAGPLTEEEQRAIEALKPAKEQNRFYLRLFGYSGKQNVSRFSNLSPGANAGGQVNETAIRTYQNRASFALGYDAQACRLELEYIRLSKMYYRVTPMLLNIGSTEGIDATIRSYAWFLNLVFDLRGVAERFYPFALVGIGGAYNRVSSVLINRPANTIENGRQSNFHMAYGLGVGVRLGLTSRLYVDTQARYLKLGYTNLKPEPNIYLRGQHSLTFLSLGLMYLF